MQHDEGMPRRHFTQAARDAALARRRELAALPKEPSDHPRVFVTRGAAGGNGYGWEIRRFGAIVVARSDQAYATADEARDAGEGAIEGILQGV